MPASRRTLLAGIVPAALATGCHALPAALPKQADAAVPAEPHPDAGLLALVAEFEAADRESDASWEALSIVDERIGATMPDRPAALRRKGDFEYFYGEACNPRSPEFYTAAEVSGFFRDYKAPVATLCPDWRRRQAARAREIVEAHDAWTAAMKRHEEETGYAALHRQHEALLDRRHGLIKQVRATPATTFAGVTAKARVARAADWDGFDAEVLAELVALGGGAA